MSRFAALLMGALLYGTISCSRAPNPSSESSFDAGIRMLMIRHRVADYPVWRNAYVANDSMRSANGLISRNIGRGLEDTNMVIIYTLVSDLTKARDFAASPLLKETMAKAGVMDSTTFIFGEVLRRDTSELATQDRVLIGYHVKDFDTWLTTFDHQGPEVRAANGFIDRGILRNLDDPKFVYVAMAVSDLQKARNWLTSDAFQSFNQQAGVEGIPEVFYYRREKNK